MSGGIALASFNTDFRVVSCLFLATAAMSTSAIDTGLTADPRRFGAEFGRFGDRLNKPFKMLPGAAAEGEAELSARLARRAWIRSRSFSAKFARRLSSFSALSSSVSFFLRPIFSMTFLFAIALIFSSAVATRRVPVRILAHSAAFWASVRDFRVATFDTGRPREVRGEPSSGFSFLTKGSIAGARWTACGSSKAFPPGVRA
mmetsp:Transcript_18837/g.34909  ORF Transcript_18837/g.34909 Transcript_18837/m.34909 type:complete len:202 (+) Transcript_18837:697-1302(+)